MGHVYSDTFYNYIEQGSRASARAVAKIIMPSLAPQSLLDVGCGRGAWLAEWHAAGINDLQGIDGDYVDRSTLRVKPDQFQGRDLRHAFDLGRKFDLVQSLEVAEHIPVEFAATFIDNLVRHGDIVMFSAAVPGQGGEDHINEQPLEFWRGHFRRHGYEPYDVVRAQLQENMDVAPWYKYNTLVYIHPGAEQRIPEQWKARKISRDVRIDEGGTLAWRMRRAIVRLLPRKIVDEIAVRNAVRIARKLDPSSI
jgi:SAM-dependent methyltransferase